MEKRNQDTGKREMFANVRFGRSKISYLPALSERFITLSPALLTVEYFPSQSARDMIRGENTERTLAYICLAQRTAAQKVLKKSYGRAAEDLQQLRDEGKVLIIGNPDPAKAGRSLESYLLQGAQNYGCKIIFSPFRQTVNGVIPLTCVWTNLRKQQVLLRLVQKESHCLLAIVDSCIPAWCTVCAP
eukprot:1159970-Pelagomonas_calceolata.AAC.11